MANFEYDRVAATDDISYIYTIDGMLTNSVDFMQYFYAKT